MVANFIDARDQSHFYTGYILYLYATIPIGINHDKISNTYSKTF